MTEAEKFYLSEKVDSGVAMGHWRLAAISSAVVAVVAIMGLLWVVLSNGSRHAYIVRIEPGGRTEVVAEGVSFKRQPEEVKWFIRKFCNQYFSRDRLTIQGLPETLLYFAPSVRQEVEDGWKSARVIENVTSNSSGTQVDAVAAQPQLSRSGTEAYVQVRLDRRVNGQRIEDSTQASTYIRFECLACSGKPVPDSISGVNPLGFQITNIPFLEGEK